MAKRTITTLLDDLDGTPATSTVTFALSGTTYEIDLSDANAARLDDTLAPFIRAARPLSAARRRAITTAARPAAPVQSPERRADLDEVRAGARENGHTVADRDRAAAAIHDAYDAYDAAHQLT